MADEVEAWSYDSGIVLHSIVYLRDKPLSSYFSRYMGSLREPAGSSVPEEMYAVLSPQEGETVGSSSVYTKAISTALELFARSDNGKLDTGKNPNSSHIFQWLTTPTSHPSVLTDVDFLMPELLRRSLTWSYWKRKITCISQLRFPKGDWWKRSKSKSWSLVQEIYTSIIRV